MQDKWLTFIGTKKTSHSKILLNLIFFVLVIDWAYILSLYRLNEIWNDRIRYEQITAPSNNP